MSINCFFSFFLLRIIDNEIEENHYLPDEIDTKVKDQIDNLETMNLNVKSPIDRQKMK